MNTDIRVAVGFWHHPKTKRLIREAGFEAVRSLQILWMWVAQNRPNGDISDLDVIDIEAAADWYGPEGEFFAAIKGRWLDTERTNSDAERWQSDGNSDATATQTGLFLHDWIEHNLWVSEADERSGKARLSKLKQVNIAAYNLLKSQGVEVLTSDEYHKWRNFKVNTKTANAERTQSERRANAERTPCPSQLAPSPSPTPSLKKKTTTTASVESPEKSGCGGFSSSRGEIPMEVMAYIDQSFSITKTSGRLKTTEARYKAALVKKWLSGELDISDAVELREAESRGGRPLTAGDILQRKMDENGGVIPKEEWELECEQAEREWAERQPKSH